MVVAVPAMVGVEWLRLILRGYIFPCAYTSTVTSVAWSQDRIQDTGHKGVGVTVKYWNAGHAGSHVQQLFLHIHIYIYI